MSFHQACFFTIKSAEDISYDLGSTSYTCKSGVISISWFWLSWTCIVGLPCFALIYLIKSGVSEFFQDFYYWVWYSSSSCICLFEQLSFFLKREQLVCNLTCIQLVQTSLNYDKPRKFLLWILCSFVKCFCSSWPFLWIGSTLFFLIEGFKFESLPFS